MKIINDKCRHVFLLKRSFLHSINCILVIWVGSCQTLFLETTQFISGNLLALDKINISLLSLGESLGFSYCVICILYGIEFYVTVCVTQGGAKVGSQLVVQKIIQ